MTGRAFAAALLFCALGATTAAAGDRTTDAVWNVGGQAGMTLASAAIQHRIHAWRDVIRCLAVGSVAGLGMYEAKSLVGRDHPRTGWVLANVAGSLSENAAADRHPLARIGYTVGPVRMHFSVPGLDRSGAWIAADASIYETIALAATLADRRHARVRDGLIGFERTLRPDDEHIGETAGVFPSVFVDDRIVWLHEFVHALQALQIDVAEPPSPWQRLRFDRPAQTKKRLFAFEQIKIGMFNFANDAYVALLPYEQRWPEIEAFQLTAPSDPWR